MRDAYRILVENLREKDHLENPYIDRKIIQGLSFRKWYGEIYRIYLAQDSDRWRRVVIAVMNLRVP